jgi:WYL_2, Sm-like SH3 beta-barrel fold
MTELLIKNIISEILFNNRICESEENSYVVNFLYDKMLCERLLIGEPIDIIELRNILRKKIVNFEFIKLSGEPRKALGTLMMKYVPQRQHPKGIRPSSPTVATFYDLQKHDWRSVSQDSKEIVLKKDEMTGKPVVMVKDKPEGKEIPVEKPEVTPEVTPEERDINVGDLFQFSKYANIHYKSGETKKYLVPTFITITRKTDEGYWGKTSGSEKDILLTPERLERLGDKVEVGDEFQFTKLDKDSNKVFTTITITNKDDQGYWGKTEGSKKDILLTNERLKRLHKYEQPDLTVNGEPMEKPVEPVAPREPGEPVKAAVQKVKPKPKTEMTKTYHFRNPVTGAVQTSEMSAKDVIKKLKALGKDWHLETPDEFEQNNTKVKNLHAPENPEVAEAPEKEKPTPKIPPIIRNNQNLENTEADEL